MRRLLLVSAALLAGCTFGAPHASQSVSVPGASITSIDVDLTLDPDAPLAAGMAGGYRPLPVVVAAGTFVRFTNSDGFAHTATSISGSTFPSASPFDAGALSEFGDRLSTGFSTGALSAGGSSAPILADQPGTYLFGCFYHYAAPMRDEIVVQ